MDSKVNLCRSLPPLVEGKAHGYLKLTIDEIIWINKNPEDVTVLAYWWGELDSAQFRPTDILTDIERSEQETSEIYIIRTNTSLFKEYIKNCEAVELVIVECDKRKVLGTGQITQLLDIFETKSYFRYVPIYDNSGCKIGELHVSMKLINMTKSSMVHSKASKLQKYCIDDDDNASLHINAKFKYNKERSPKIAERTDNNMYSLNKIMGHDENDIYKSVLKAKRMEFENPNRKVNAEVTDKLVAQIVARAQRLRGAILKETYNEDSLAFSDNSIDESVHRDKASENEAKLYEYILGKDMSISDERKALNTLRSISPAQSLINFASDTITSCKYNNVESMPSQAPFLNTNYIDENLPKSVLNERKASPLSHVDSIKIYIETFSLSPAGCRRVRSSCLTRTDGLQQQVTYIVQYDPTFGNNKQKYKKLSEKHDKPVRISSKKQTGDVINFNHEAEYNLAHINLDLDLSLYFKILIRHLNQKSPTELGIGCIYIRDIAKTEDLRTTQLLSIFNKGIKIGELKVSIELGCDYVHLKKQYINAIISTKENIPIMEMQSLSSVESDKFRSTTGTQSKTSSNKISSVQTKRIERLSANNNNNDLIITRDRTRHDKRNMDDQKIDVKNPEIDTENKILLHGLIHIAEGKDLPELSTYLICRAFWKEDRATSKICINTKNPFYQFCQLVPLIHGADLLERIKDNYIIIEVYSKNNTGVDNLLGIVKLPVHQLYVAYRDPLVLPYLLQSKYPVISVDEWVPICNPVNGQFSGQLLALVALGTAEQIAFLKMSRGLTNNSSQVICGDSSNDYINHPGCSKHNLDEERDNSRHSHKTTEIFHLNGNFANHNSNFKSQEVQTDITVFEEPKQSTNIVPINSAKEEATNPDCLVLHSLVDRLAHALSATKSNVDQMAQTEISEMEKMQLIDAEQSRFNTLNISIPSDESDSTSHTNNFHLPIESYRSVGVGAEFDEEANQKPSNHCNNASLHSTSDPQNPEKDELDFDQFDSNRKSVSTVSVTQAPSCNLPQSNWAPSHFYQTQNTTVKRNETSIPLVAHTQRNEDALNQREFLLNEPIFNSHNLDDASLPFLSLSLKQKLTELDEITKRLQSRLRDVTNNAFEDDFVNEFDLNEPNSDNENNDNGNTNASPSAMTVQGIREAWDAIPSGSKHDHNNQNIHETRENENRISPSSNDIQNRLTSSNTSESRPINYEPFDPGYCTGSNFQSSQNLTASDYRTQCQNECSLQTDNSSETSLDYPARGTKMHINHLLDKLSLQFPSTSFQSKHLSMKNVTKLLTNVQQCKNSERKNDFDFETIGISRPSQIVTENTQSTQTPHSFTSNQYDSVDSQDFNEERTKSQTSHKISSVIREELVADENNDTTKCDELTSYLITSNVRHMSIDNIFNPLLYQHLASDLHVSNIVSPDGEAIDQLDNRYVRTFKSTLNNGLSRLENFMDASVSSVNGNSRSTNTDKYEKSHESMKKSHRVTPTGVSNDIDGKISLNVTPKSNNNGLTTSNNTASTTTISLDKYSEKQTDTDIDGNSCSMLSDAFVSAVSRQAPDGGNPMEDTIKPVATIQHNDSLDYSSSS